MKVILLQDVKNIGQKGEIVQVSDGYAFNNLIPRGIARTVTQQVLAQKKRNDIKIQHDHEQQLENLRSQANKLNKKKIIIHAQAKGNKLFGSVTAKDISVAIQEQLHISINEKSIQLEAPIKETTTREITIDHGFHIHSTIIMTIAPK